MLQIFWKNCQQILEFETGNTFFNISSSDDLFIPSEFSWGCIELHTQFLKVFGPLKQGFGELIKSTKCFVFPHILTLIQTYPVLFLKNVREKIYEF